MFINSVFDETESRATDLGLPNQFLTDLINVDLQSRISFNNTISPIVPVDMLLMLKFHHAVLDSENIEHLPISIRLTQYNYRDNESAQNTIKRAMVKTTSNYDAIKILYNPTGIVKARAFLKEEGFLNEDFRLRAFENSLISEEAQITEIYYEKSKHVIRIITNRCDYNFVRRVISMIPLIHCTPITKFIDVYKAYADLDLDAWVKALTSLNTLQDAFENKRIEQLKDVIGQRQDRFIRDVDYRIRECKEQIAKYERYLTDYYKKLDEQESYRRGILLKPDKDETLKDLLGYLKSNKSVTIKEVASEFITFKVKAPIMYYDADFLKKYIEKGTVLYSETISVFKAVFIEDNYKLLTETDFVINLRDISVNCPQRWNDYTYFPQPHLNFYNCWGNNKPLILKALKDYDLIGAIEQSIGAHMNMNFSDTTVTATLSQRLLESNFKNLKTFVDKEGNLYSFNEIKREVEQNG